MPHLNESQKRALRGVAEAKKAKPSKPVHLRLTLDVTYKPGSTSIDELKRMLEGLVEYGMGEGLITGETDAEVEKHTVNVETV